MRGAAASRCSTATAIPALAPEGEMQAALWPSGSRPSRSAALFVTPLQRTAQTAAPLAARLGLEPVVVPELLEVFLGDWDGGEFRVRLAEGDPIALQAVEEERWDVIPGAETMEAFALRVRAGVEAVIAAAGPDADGGRDRARRRHRRGLPPGHGEPAVRVRAQRQRLGVAARRAPRRPLAAAVVQRHNAFGIGCVKSRHMDDATLERFADVIVGFGANVQPGQIVAISCEPGKEFMVRAIAASAYRHGAKFVDVQYFDPWVKRARIEHAREEDLDFIPDWHGKRLLALGDVGAARVGLSGPVAPGLLEDLDPARVGRDRFPSLKEAGKVVNDRTTNWTIAPCPTPAWAKVVFPDLDAGAALEQLEAHLLHVCRLDEEDPIAAWRSRADFLVATAERLSGRRFDALHYEGPGTDLTVGLLPGHTWQAARFARADGLVHMPNLPTEEVFTSPDPERASTARSPPPSRSC